MEVPKKSPRTKHPGKGTHSASQHPTPTTQNGRLHDLPGKKKCPHASTPVRNKDGTDGRSKVTGERSRTPGEKKRTPETRKANKERPRKEERSEKINPAIESPTGVLNEKRQTISGSRKDKETKDVTSDRKELSSAMDDAHALRPNQTASRSDSSAIESRTQDPRPPVRKERNLNEVSSESEPRAATKENHRRVGKQPHEHVDLEHVKDVEDKFQVGDRERNRTQTQRPRPAAATVVNRAGDNKEPLNRKEVNRLQSATDESSSMDSSLDLSMSKASLTSSLASRLFLSHGKHTSCDLLDSLDSSLTSSQFTASSLLNSPPSSLLHNNSDSSDSTNRMILGMLTRHGSQGSLSSASSSQSRSLCNYSDMISLPSMSSFNDSSLEESRFGLPSGVMYRGESVDPTIEAYTQQLTGAGLTQQNIDAKIAVSIFICV